MQERKRLSDILPRADREKIGALWASTKPADDLVPIPAGIYKCRITDGTAFTAKSGTPGYKLTLELLEGEYADRRLWWDCWFTEAALGMAKRDLAKLGITSFEQLERPLPEGIIVNAMVAIRKNDDGTEFNRVKRLDVIGVEPPQAEPFAPTDEPEGPTTDDDGFDWSAGRQTEGNTQ